MGYVAVTVALVAALMSGVFWLVQPDPSLTQEVKASPIPPRIAESIERKRSPPVAEPVAEPVKVQPVLQETNVSLTSQPALKVKIRELTSPLARKRKPKGDDRVLGAVVENQSARAIRRMTRDDFPY